MIKHIDMKTMNLVLALFILSFGISCDQDNSLNQEQEVNNELLTSKDEVSQKFAEPEAYLELHFHQYFLEKEMILLKQRLQVLLEGIDNENEEMIYELESVQEQLETYETFHDYNEEFIRIIDVPRLPPRPHPCENPTPENNCIHELSSNLEMLFLEEQGEIELGLLQEGENLDFEGDINESENFEGLMSIQSELEFSGIAQLKITKYYEPADSEITYIINVSQTE